MRRKFTAANRDALVQLLATGNTVRAACGMVGVHHSVFYDWLREGEEGREDSTKAQFAQDVRAALAQAEVGAQLVIQRAMKDDPKWAAWYLERRNPEEWGKRERHEVTGAEGGPISIDLRWPDVPTPPSQMP